MTDLIKFEGRRRLPPDVRKSQIIRAATEFFALHGFSGSTRDLASEIGVTQALIYRYFDKKDDLIRAVFDGMHEAVSEARAEGPADVSGTLAQQVAQIYVRYLRLYAGYHLLRLNMYSALGGFQFHLRADDPLAGLVVEPIREAIARDAGRRPGDRAWLRQLDETFLKPLHVAMIGISIDRHIRGQAMTDAEFERAVERTAEIFVAGSLATLKAG